MKPPADRLLDFHGSGADAPLHVTAPYRLRWLHVFLAASALGLLSTTLAWQFTRIVGRDPAPVRSLAVLNFSWWYLWALMAPAVLGLARRHRFERGRLLRAVAVHVPAVVTFSLTHIAGMETARWWLARTANEPYAWWASFQRSAILYFDWEMMTYWAIVGLSHALVYYSESTARAVRAAHLERKLVEAQLNVLQQQLHPHFLFNTLHAISSLMRTDVDAAERVLMQLSDLLRLTLEHLGQHEVTVGAELQALSKYAQIEQTRFGDRLTVRYDIQPEALEARVPCLLLQPLVENAIKHGVARRAGPGHVLVAARRDGDKLRLEVRDDGVGLSEDALTALQKGIGVSTTRARLQHLFGAECRFEFHRLVQGLAVVIAVPWNTLPAASARQATPGPARPASGQLATAPGAFQAPDSAAARAALSQSNTRGLPS